MAKTIHMADRVSEVGVSPFCARTPNPINLKLASWTLRASAVTCPRCKAEIKRRIKPAEAECERVGKSLSHLGFVCQYGRDNGFGELATEALRPITEHIVDALALANQTLRRLRGEEAATDRVDSDLLARLTEQATVEEAS